MEHQTHGQQERKPLRMLTLRTCQDMADALAEHHRQSLAAGHRTYSRYFSIEATPTAVLTDAGAKRLAIWEALGGDTPPEDLEELMAARVGYTVVEYRSSPLGSGLGFVEATAEYLEHARDSAVYHPETSLGAIVVHTSEIPGGHVLVSKVFTPDGPPEGSTRVEYWDPAAPETGLTSYPWDARLPNHVAYRTYLPSPYHASQEDIAAWEAASRRKPLP